MNLVDVKSGKIYEKMSDAISAYCKKNSCTECSVCDNGDIRDMALDYPEKTAKIMGFGIVEKKPKLCEVLGVNLNEIFRYNKNFYKVAMDSSGSVYLLTERFGHWEDICTYDFNMLDNADKIIHICRWSEKDIEDAKAMMQLYPNVVAVGKEDDTIFMIDAAQETIGCITNGNDFPSLNCGEIVLLEEIVGKPVPEQK